MYKNLFNNKEEPINEIKRNLKIDQSNVFLENATKQRQIINFNSPRYSLHNKREVKEARHIKA
ncbi:hypothetical protein BKG92_02170 [Rodentibacter ratti]|uniref:Uncharacterized protein n=1 Tax=Rodentibacter ratti TaxID=1906745 RepID=A0A1V3L1I7_9PAST|nr:hypothetical protein BKG92_02170 [Rodentibacter ratti]